MSVQTTDDDEDELRRPRAVTGTFPFNKHWSLEFVGNFDRMLASQCTLSTFVIFFGQRGIPEAEVRRRYYEKKREQPTS